jgi:predicted N-acyltransferase
MRDAGFADAVAQYLEAERAAVEEDIEILTKFGPFKKTDMEDHQ